MFEKLPCETNTRRPLHRLPPAPSSQAHIKKKKTLFHLKDTWASQVEREARPGWISQKAETVARSEPFIGNDHRRPQCTWKMYETRRRGRGSMKIDYLSLALAGSPGSVTSFVPLGHLVENDTRGKSWVCLHVCLIERAEPRLFTDGIAWHKHRRTT